MTRWQKWVAIGVSVLSLLTPPTLWIDGRYAKAADVKRIEQQLAEARLEIRVGQIKNTLAYLRQEEFELQAARETRKLSALESQRLRDVETDIRSSERELRILLRQQMDTVP